MRADGTRAGDLDVLDLLAFEQLQLLEALGDELAEHVGGVPEGLEELDPELVVDLGDGDAEDLNGLAVRLGRDGAAGRELGSVVAVHRACSLSVSGRAGGREGGGGIRRTPVPPLDADLRRRAEHLDDLPVERLHGALKQLVARREVHLLGVVDAGNAGSADERVVRAYVQHIVGAHPRPAVEVEAVVLVRDGAPLPRIDLERRLLLPVFDQVLDQPLQRIRRPVGALSCLECRVRQAVVGRTLVAPFSVWHGGVSTTADGARDGTHRLSRPRLGRSCSRGVRRRPWLSAVVIGRRGRGVEGRKKRWVSICRAVRTYGK